MDNGQIPPGKRKKTVPKCPNPLFLYWLKELRDDAAAKGSKTQYTYGKAMKSLQKYPVRLPDGKSCKILESVGDKICQILDKKLAEHVDVYGSADFVPDEIAEALPGYRKPQRKQAPAAAAAAARHLDSGSDNENVGVNNTGKKQRKKSGGGREYLPQPGSGPYAMLLTLLRVAGERGYMMKAELMEEAQHLSDTSFSVPDPGTRYTAWSSMGTLIRRGLVIKRSSPAKYNLTPAGVELAQRLLELDANGRGQNGGAAGPNEDAGLNFVLGGAHVLPRQAAPPPLPRRPTPLQEAAPAWPTLPNNPTADMSHEPVRNRIHTFSSGSDDVDMSPARTPSNSKPHFPGRGHTLGGSAEKRANPVPWRVEERSPSPPPYALPDLDVPLFNPGPPQTEYGMKFAYCTEEGTEVRHKDKAAVTIEDTLGGLGFLISCSYDDLINSAKLYTRDYTKVGSGGKVFAYLADKDAPETSPLPTQQTTIPKREPTATVTGRIPAVPPPISKPAKTAKPKPKSETVTTKTLDTKPTNLAGAWAMPIAGPSGSGLGGQRPGQRRSPWDAGSTASSSAAGSRESSQDVDYDKAGIDEEPAFTLNPGSFDVILCVDKREHFGGAKSSKQLLLPELQKHQTKYELRNLQIGDFAWVARPKNAPEGDRELVLDHVVERKRMDDLASSIVDGRFKEQKVSNADQSKLEPDYSENKFIENSENVDPNINSNQQTGTNVPQNTQKLSSETLDCSEIDAQETVNAKCPSETRKFKFAKLQTSITDWTKTDKTTHILASEKSQTVDHERINSIEPKAGLETSIRLCDQNKAKPCRGTLDNFLTKTREPSGNKPSCSRIEMTQTNTVPQMTRSGARENCNSSQTTEEPMETCHNSFNKSKTTEKDIEKGSTEINKKLHQLQIGEGGLERYAKETAESMDDPVSVKNDMGTFEPLVAPTIERLPIGVYEQVFFDLEATGLGMHSHIVQLAAAGPFGSFNRYVKPKVPMNREASAVTGIKSFKGRLFHKGRCVFTTPIRQCLEQFLRSLPRDPTLLVGHNAHQYDARLLLTAARNCNMEDAFVKKVCGFLDTLPLFRAERPDNKKNSQEALVKQYLGDSYNAHNAKADSSALRKLLRHCNFNREQLMAHTVSTGYVLKLLDYEEKKRSNYESLKMLVEGCALSEGMAEKAARAGLRYEHFTEAHKSGGAQAVHELLLAPNAEGKPRVTKSTKILNTVSDFLKDLSEYS